MNTDNKGSLNFARLIAEAEALLMGETTTPACTNCGNCKNGADKDGCGAGRAAATKTAQRPTVAAVTR